MSTEAGTDQAASIPPPETGEDIVARAGKYYRNTRYVMFILLVGMGGWFLYDGFITYPHENEVVAQLKTDLQKAIASGNQSEQGRIQTELSKHTSHNDWGLLSQRLLGFGLPPIGVIALWWALHRSRGEYRLSGTKLSVPGHPTIDLSEIQKDEINNDLWDRKGIVWLGYKTADGQEGEIVLDDFIYDRPPTDKIYERIAATFGLTEEDEDDGDDDEGESSENTE